MGLFDLLSKDGRERSSLEKSMARAKDPLVKSEDRFPALEKLKQIGTEEALFGLAHRFSVRCDKMMEDEQEKEWVYETFLALGDKAIPPLRRYCLAADSVSWPLRIFETLCDEAHLTAVADELLAKLEPGYTRDPSKKVQVLGWLGDLDKLPAPEIARRVVPYVADFDETVRFTAVESLDRKRDEASSKTQLLAALVRKEEESKRLRVRIAQLLADAGWSLAGAPPELKALLSQDLDGFKLDKDKLVRKGG